MKLEPCVPSSCVLQHCLSPSEGAELRAAPPAICGGLAVLPSALRTVWVVAFLAQAQSRHHSAQAPLTHLLSDWCLRCCSGMLLSPLVSPDHKTILLYLQTPQSQQLHWAGGTNTLLNTQAGSPGQGRTGPPGSPRLTVQPAGLLWVLFNTIKASGTPYGSRGCSSAGFGLQHRSYAWQRQQSSSPHPVPQWPGVTKGSDATRVSPAHTSAQSMEKNSFLSQGLLCPSGMWKGKKFCLGFWRALLWVGGTGGDGSESQDASLGV